MSTIAITGASGKLGNATLTALLTHTNHPPSSIIPLTSSHPSSPTWTSLLSQNPSLQVRHATFNDPSTFEYALRGVDKLFLVSTPHVALDFEHEDGREKEDGEGREKHHRVAIDAAVKAGVGHIYYSSLAFAWNTQTQAPGSTSKAGVMRAHLRTEAYLSRLSAEGKVKVTVLREGLYNESWPLYLFGYGNGNDGGGDGREVVPVRGDGRVCWTGIKELGVGSALVVAAEDGGFDGRTVYLSSRARDARSLAEVAEVVGRVRGEGLGVRVVGREEYERYYIEERGGDRGAVRWWAGTYEAIRDEECEVDDPTLERLLASVGVKSKGVEECIAEMVKKADK
ncbi:NAD(P)-binding protein [Annulohypoxylon maeteangense]|uniref:NAD(P)-binding protein n=1 Tax=Annulohypoxylon maeteangense TaxID=1927788 RepID=UPI00200857E7|nr:NAD(P)-binding protein [Annulohypoxylon maeteangense]KAI0884634.1 NAD(P)-binding protein [Annulohypoxylon maeteangense]